MARGGDNERPDAMSQMNFVLYIDNFFCMYGEVVECVRLDMVVSKPVRRYTFPERSRRLAYL